MLKILFWVKIFSKIGTELYITLFLLCLAICCSYSWTECCYYMLPIHCV